MTNNVEIRFRIDPKHYDTIKIRSIYLTEQSGIEITPGEVARAIFYKAVENFAKEEAAKNKAKPNKK
jgi:hypothetical protein